MKVLIISVFVLALIASFASAGEDDDFIKKLRHELLEKRGYDKMSRPAKNWKKTINVEIGIQITNIRGICIKTQMLDSEGWLQMTWTDDYLSWTPIDFGGITEIRLNSDEIWKPDILFYNGGSLTSATSLTANTNAIAFSNGKVMWVPPISMKTLCPVDVRHYPHDVHICNMTLGSWTFHDQLVNVSIAKKGMLEGAPDTRYNSGWKLIGNKTIREERNYDCCKGQVYPSATLQLTFKRHNPVFCYAVVLPQIVSLLMTLSVFWIPAKSLKIRSGLAALAMGLSYGTINYMVEQVGSQTNQVPYAVRCSGTLLAMAALSVIISLIVNRLANCSKPTHLPVMLTNSTSGVLGTILCIEKDPLVEADKQGKEVPGDGSNDWKLVATLVDRIFFFLMVIAGLASHL